MALLAPVRRTVLKSETRPFPRGAEEKGPVVDFGVESDEGTIVEKKDATSPAAPQKIPLAYEITPPGGVCDTVPSDDT